MVGTGGQRETRTSNWSDQRKSRTRRQSRNALSLSSRSRVLKSILCVAFRVRTVGLNEEMGGGVFGSCAGELQDSVVLAVL